MARPHIEFIQAQMIPWRRGLYGNARSEVEVRTLSFDDDTGASSLIIRYPAGYSRPDPEYLEVDEEFFVLDGAIEMNGQNYDRHTYGHFPARYVRKMTRSGAGAVVITFFSGEPRTHRGIPTGGMSHPERLVPYLDTRRMEGNESARKEMFPGIKTSGSLHKRLKTDPVTGEITWLVAVRGGVVMTQNETHPVIEEEYALSGDQIGPHGNMRPGAYFWRPANIKHGPFATATGAYHLVRGIGGKYTTLLEDQPGPFPWDTPYNPILPPEYQDYVAGYKDQETSY